MQLWRVLHKQELSKGAKLCFFLNFLAIANHLQNDAFFISIVDDFNYPRVFHVSPGRISIKSIGLFCIAFKGCAYNLEVFQAGKKGLGVRTNERIES